MHAEETDVPLLTRQEIDECLGAAASAKRRRHPKILHAPGDVLNRVFNFMMHDSYMQPHLHPGAEKIERIHLVEGRLAVLFFDDHGGVTDVALLERGGRQYVDVPAFTWHTYVMLSEQVITYETMVGRYEPATWKDMAAWAPPENAADSLAYLHFLKEEAEKRTAAIE